MSTITQISLIVYPTLGAPWLMRLARASEIVTRRSAQFVIYVWLIYIQFVQHYLATVGLDLSLFDIKFHVDSYWIFPLGLISVLYAFITYNPTTFGRMLVAIILANLAMAALILLHNQGWVTVIPNSWKGFYDDGAALILAVGTLLLVVDSAIMICLYLFIEKHTSSIFWCIWAPLIAALVFDAAGFSWVVAHCRKGNYSPVLSDQLGAKLIAGTVYAGWFSLCSRRSEVSPIVMNQVGALRRFFSEALPLHKAFHCLIPMFSPHVFNLTRQVKSGISHANMRERSKEAARSAAEKQASDRAKRVASDQQTFVDAVGGTAGLGLSQSITDGIATFRRDLSELLKTHRNEWVAYHGSECLGFGAKKVELYRRMLAQGINRDELTIRLINEDSLCETGVYDSSAKSL